MDNEQTIRKNVAAIGGDYDNISDNLRSYLVSVQNIIDRKKAEQQTAIKLLQDSNVTVSGICAELRMSRNTAYRYGSLLQRYIDYSANQLANTNPLVIIDKLKEDNSEKQRQIFLMADRDIDALTTTFAIKHRDRLLQEKINLLEQKNKRIMELTRDCQQLRIALEQSAPNHRLLKIPK